VLHPAPAARLLASSRAALPADLLARPSQPLPDGHLWFAHADDAGAAQAVVVRALTTSGFVPYAAETVDAGGERQSVVWARSAEAEAAATAAAAAPGGTEGAGAAAREDGAETLASAVASALPEGVSLEDVPKKQRRAVTAALRGYMRAVRAAAEAALRAGGGRSSSKSGGGGEPSNEGEGAAAEEDEDADGGSKGGRRRRVRMVRAKLYVREVLCAVDGDVLQHAESEGEVLDAFRFAMRHTLARALQEDHVGALGLHPSAASVVTRGPEMSSEWEFVGGSGGDGHDDDEGGSGEEAEAEAELERMEAQERENVAAQARASARKADAPADDDADDADADADAETTTAQEEAVDTDGFYPESVVRRTARRCTRTACSGATLR
jgi:hypothetical protein